MFNARVNFARIYYSVEIHLHDNKRTLTLCMAANPDPRILRGMPITTLNTVIFMFSVIVKIGVGNSRQNPAIGRMTNRGSGFSRVRRAARVAESNLHSSFSFSLIGA